jgi:Zn-dependent protease with chaperone function
MMTDFFERQDDARRRTGRLLILFGLAVAVIVAAVYLAVTLVVVGNAPNAAVFSPTRLSLVTTLVLLGITLGSLYKVYSLRDGGDSVARLLGGRLVESTTTELKERQLLNVVEEMAVAAGTAMPPVYVLDQEPGINAFAAGFTPGDAVVAVSRGAIEHLTRDELQGVIGHEFSHILHGDMRLNLRLIGLIHGILVLALTGRLLVELVFRNSSDTGKDGFWVIVSLMVSGLTLMLIGSLGVLLGRIIKCAVSRQREFLADASSVQYTRNPEGLAGALKKIGGLTAGSRIRSPNAEQACHMFFGPGVPSLTSLLATHPPLEERIRRLDPTFDGTFPRVDTADAESDVETYLSRLAGQASAEGTTDSTPIPLTPQDALSAVGAPSPSHVAYASGLLDRLPAELTAAVREPFSAHAVIYALLLDPAASIRAQQLIDLSSDAELGVVDEVLRLLPAVTALGELGRLPLVDVTIPTLRRLSNDQYRTFRRRVDALVRADGRVSLFEFALLRVLLRHLDRAFNKERPRGVRFHTLDAVFSDVGVVISALARIGHQEDAGIAAAFATGMAHLQRDRPGQRAVTLAAREACAFGPVDRALDRIAVATPAIKRRALDACAATIVADGVVTPAEAELLRAIADSIDCPMPPLYASSSPLTAARASAVPSARV